MKVYVINLDRDKDKLAFMDSQLRDLGVEYERISGVWGADIPGGYEKFVHRFRWWCAIGRAVKPAEVGCALSHYSIYEKITEPVCILEDDVRIDEEFPRRLVEIEALIEVSRPQVVLLSSHEQKRQGRGIKRDSRGMCTDGYVITPAAAQMLRRANLPMIVPCDHWNRWVRLQGLELFHSLPPVVQQCQERFGTSTQANVSRVDQYPLIQWLAHKSARVMGIFLTKIFDAVAV